MIDDGTLVNRYVSKPDDDKVIVKTTYDNSDVIEANKRAQNSGTIKEQYSGNLVHAARIHEGDIIRLKSLGYDLLSPDRDEWKRCLLYIQTNEPHLLTVRGKPFTKKRPVWV
jgi:hypothetical protein